MVHGTDKHARPLLSFFPPAVIRRSNTIARLLRLGTAIFRKELLPLSPLVLTYLSWFGLGGLRLGWCLHLLRLGLRCALLARLVLAAAPAAPMPLRLTLAIGWG
jgi:hypothetical protein